MMHSISPTTGDVIAEFDETSPADVIRHVESSANLQREWARTSIDERRIPMDRLAEVLESRRDQLAVLMANEMGKPVVQGRSEVDKCAEVCRYYAQETQRILAHEHIEADRTKSYVTYRPLGVILAVMPWNFPLWQVFRFLAPALMAGNAGLLKHASNVTGCAMAIDEMVVEAGFPDGLFRTLILSAARVNEALGHPKVVAATLTGSGAAGRAIAARAGALLKKTVLELGGSDPYIVLEDADIDVAAAACSTSRLINGGQSCISAKRFIVHEAVVDEFTDRLVAEMSKASMGDPLDESITLGPMARTDLRDKLHDQVVRSIEAGAALLLGGRVPDGPGAFYPPTVLSKVAPDMAVFAEETFGPVASITTAESEEEAIRLANDTPFGLGAAVFTNDIERGERIARDELQAGACFVNGFVASDPRLPFGGIKASGYGRELSGLGMKEFMNAKTVVVA
jgi:succinate-semialdehyde dehydrogenase/glutarate-semialdehyde dehydrogenase